MKNPWFRFAWIIAPIVAGLIGMGLATSYWLSVGADFSDAVYRGLTILGTGDAHREIGKYSNQTTMNLARFLGAFAVLSAAIGTIYAVLRDTLARLRARLGHQEIVVIGSAQVAKAALGTIKAFGNKHVLHLGTQSFQASLRTTCLLWEDQDRKSEMASLHVAGAKNVLVAEHDDAETLSIARAVHASAPGAIVTALVTDLAIASGAGKAASDGRLRIRSIGEVSARALHRDHAPFVRAHDLGQARIHALIVGFGDMGEAIARDLIINCRTTKLALPHLSIVDPAIDHRLHALRLTAPELDETCVITPMPCTFSRCMAPLADNASEPFTCAYICLDTDTNTLIALAGVQAWLRQIGQTECPVYVRLRDKSALAIAPGAPIAFGDLHDLVAESECFSTTPDHAARAYHSAYLRTLSDEKRNASNNPATKPWDELGEGYRAANRAAVAHIAAKVASAGVSMPVATTGLLSLPSGTKLFSNDTELMALAALEHERWNAERRLLGWQFAGIERKDEIRLLHPSLRPFDELSDEVKGYDVAFVRETARLLGGSTAV